MSRPAEEFLSVASLRATVKRIAVEIDRDYPDGVLLVGMLNGSFCFLADLFRRLEVSAEVDFMALSSFAGDVRKVKVLKDLDTDIQGRDVLVVVEIIDTGLSASFVLSLLRDRGASTVSICALLDRAAHRIIPVPVRYVGHEIDQSFVVGYGIDVSGRYRNLPNICFADPDRLDTNCEDFEQAVYATRSIDTSG